MSLAPFHHQRNTRRAFTRAFARAMFERIMSAYVARTLWVKCQLPHMFCSVPGTRIWSTRAKAALRLEVMRLEYERMMRPYSGKKRYNGAFYFIEPQLSRQPLVEDGSAHMKNGASSMRSDLDDIAETTAAAMQALRAEERRMALKWQANRLYGTSRARAMW